MPFPFMFITICSDSIPNIWSVLPFVDKSWFSSIEQCTWINCGCLNKSFFVWILLELNIAIGIQLGCGCFATLLWSYDISSSECSKLQFKTIFDNTGQIIFHMTTKDALLYDRQRIKSVEVFCGNLLRIFVQLYLDLCIESI